MRTIEKNAKGQAVAPAAVPMTKKSLKRMARRGCTGLGEGAR